VLFTFYPSLGIVMVGLHRSRDVVDPALEFLAPEMYWYGWTATAAIGALVFGLIAALLPDRWTCWFFGSSPTTGKARRTDASHRSATKSADVR
jgi:hypothetical protein